MNLWWKWRRTYGRNRGGAKLCTHSINKDRILLPLWVINDSTTANVWSLSGIVAGTVGTERGNTEYLPSSAYGSV